MTGSTMLLLPIRCACGRAFLAAPIDLRACDMCRRARRANRAGRAERQRDHKRGWRLRQREAIEAGAEGDDSTENERRAGETDSPAKTGDATMEKAAAVRAATAWLVFSGIGIIMVSFFGTRNMRDGEALPFPGNVTRKACQ